MFIYQVPKKEEYVHVIFYNTELPVGMEYMNKLNIADMNNMFEKKSTNYALASNKPSTSNNENEINDDF